MEIGNPYHYRGNPAQQINGFASLNSIPAEAHRSGIRLAPNVTSWDRNLSMPAAPYIFNTSDGDLAVMRTSSNIFSTPIGDYRKHGYFSQVDDISNFNGWLDAGTKSKPVMFEEVALPTKDGWWSGVYVSLGEKQAKFMHGDTYLRKYVNDINVIDWPNNEVGKSFSKIHNLRQALMMYYRSEEGQDFYEFLKSQGLEPDEIGYLANVAYKNVVYAVGRSNDRRVIFYTSDSSSEYINSAAEFLRINAEDLRINTIHEEVAHMARRSYDKSTALSDRLDEEEATKSMVRDFSLLKAEENEGTEKGRHYRKMAGLMQHDIDTTRERYTDIFRPKGNSLESRIESWKAEARSMRIDETEYVSAKMATRPVYGRKGKDYGDEKPTYRAASKYKGKGKEARGRDKGEKGGEKAEMTNAKAAQEDSGENPEGGEAEQVESQEEASPQ